MPGKPLTNYPYPITIRVSLIQRNIFDPCCEDYDHGRRCLCGMVVAITTNTVRSGSELREKHFFDKSCVWNAQDNNKEEHYDEQYIRARLGR